ncbi:MAG: NAD(P)-dependent alcohol dehydrogenase [Ghiorsea sp.]|nr:NAD(P)-dependent alcohol dehydrogenase [Ghiorsea sp.]
MKAVICTKYGSPEVLKLVEVDKPTPKANEVLIKICATTVHIGDVKIRSLKPGMGALKDFMIKPLMRLIIGFYGPRRKILGMECSGVVEAVGSGVTRFNEGDEVFASTEMKFGTYAEYTCVDQDGIIAHKPNNMSHAEAAAVPNGAMTALMVLRKSKKAQQHPLEQNQKIMIYGASGSVGSYAVQLAKSMGAEVTGVCSAANVNMVTSLGADHVLDYTAPDFTQHLEPHDVIFDAVGKMEADARMKAMKPDGMYLNVLKATDSLKLHLEDLLYLKTLIEDGKLKTAIDKTYPLADMVEAHSYVEQGHKKGNVVITVAQT